MATHRGSATALGSPTISDSGIIERNTDVDYFSFSSGGGALNVDFNPAPFGPNLDILAKLYNSSGDEITSSNPIDDLFASISWQLAAGVYYLSVEKGQGNRQRLQTQATPITEVLGYYTIEGTIASTTHTVTASAGSFGTIDPDGVTPVPNGGSIGFFATPSSGYEVNNWKVNGSVISANKGHSDYLLPNVTGPTSVYVDFVYLGSGAGNDSWQTAH